MAAVEVALVHEQIALQDDKPAELQRQLDRHSGNSGQRPSQDGPPAPTRLHSRCRSQGRKPGGQPDHAETTRQRVAAAHVNHWLDWCNGCGAALTRTAAGARCGVKCTICQHPVFGCDQVPDADGLRRKGGRDLLAGGKRDALAARDLRREPDVPSPGRTEVVAGTRLVLT